MQLLSHLLSKVGYFLFFIILEFTAIFFMYKGSSFHQTLLGEKVIAINGYFSSKIAFAKNFRNLPEQNQLIMDENARLKDSLEFFKSYLNTYALNKDTLKIDSTHSQRFNYLSAKVIDYSVNKRNNYFMIDKGTKDGVKANMAVLTMRGLVGAVLQSTENYSTVLSVLHSNTNVKAKVKGIDYFGILKWDGRDYRFLQLTEIPKYLNVKKGDTILTAGASAIYPEGHMIGYVSSLKPNSQTGDFDIQVATFDDLTEVSNVYVVEDFDRNEIKEVEETNLDVTE